MTNVQLQCVVVQVTMGQWQTFYSVTNLQGKSEGTNGLPCYAWSRLTSQRRRDSRAKVPCKRDTDSSEYRSNKETLESGVSCGRRKDETRLRYATLKPRQAVARLKGAKNILMGNIFFSIIWFIKNFSEHNKIWGCIPPEYPPPWLQAWAKER